MDNIRKYKQLFVNACIGVAIKADVGMISPSSETCFIAGLNILNHICDNIEEINNDRVINFYNNLLIS